MNRLDAACFKSLIAAALCDVKERADEFSTLDAVSGDGDHGTAIAAAITAIDGAGNGDMDLKSLLMEMAMAAMTQSSGSTSTLIGAWLLGMSDAAGSEPLDASQTAEMFASGLANVSKQTDAKVGDRTMMDALIPATQAMQASGEQGMAEMFAAAARAAAEGAESTSDLVAKFGRARNLGDRVLGHIDPGAASMACLFAAMARACSEA